MKFSISFFISTFFISNFELSVVPTYIPRSSFILIFALLFTKKIKTLACLLGEHSVTNIPVFDAITKINFSNQSEELNIIKSSHTTFCTFTSYIL